MKKLIVLASLLALGIAPALMAQQEYDDLYFSKKDRVIQRPTVQAVKPSTDFNSLQPKFANPDYQGGALVQEEGYNPMYNYYSESLISDKGSLVNASMANNSGWGWNNSMWGGGMMSPFSMWGSPWAMYDPFMMGGWGSGFNMGWGFNTMFSPMLGFGIGSSWGSPMWNSMYSPWGMNSFMNPWNRWGWGNSFWNMPTTVVVTNPERLNQVRSIRNTVNANPRSMDAVRAVTSISDADRKYPSRLRNYESTKAYVNGISQDPASGGRYSSRSGSAYNIYDAQRTRSTSSPSYSNPQRRSDWGTPSPSPSFSSPSRSSFSSPSYTPSSGGAVRSIRRN